MIRAENFIEAARGFGINFYTGVPCSILTPFINYVINDVQLDYIASANEGDAVATAAGATIGGKSSVVMMQNSGLGNAVSPLTSLTYVFQIPILLIITHRGAPGLKDEPQHALMGEITAELLDTMRIPWEYFPEDEASIRPSLQNAINFMQKHQRPYGFIMRKDTVVPHALQQPPITKHNKTATNRKEFFHPENDRPGRNAALDKIITHTPAASSIVIATTGFTGRELYALQDRANHLYMVGSMGCASSLGLGVALSRPDLTVVVVDGDGAALMRMGNFSTIGNYQPEKFIHILLDNEAHDSTGAQATVSATVQFAEIAAACGYTTTYQGNDLTLIDQLFAEGLPAGPRFGHLKIKAGTIDKLPRPSIQPADVLRRFKAHIGTVAH